MAPMAPLGPPLAQVWDAPKFIVLGFVYNACDGEEYDLEKYHLTKLLHACTPYNYMSIPFT